MKKKLMQKIILLPLILMSVTNTRLKAESVESISSAPFLLAAGILYSEVFINLPMDAKLFWQGKYFKKWSKKHFKKWAPTFNKVTSAGCLFLSQFLFSQRNNVDKVIPYNKLKNIDNDTLYWSSMGLGILYFTLRAASHIGEWYKSYRWVKSKDSYLKHTIPSDSSDDK